MYKSSPECSPPHFLPLRWLFTHAGRKDRTLKDCPGSHPKNIPEKNENFLRNRDKKLGYPSDGNSHNPE